MPQSLHRTWVALAMATVAVLVVGFLAGRDFVRNITASCSAHVAEQDVPMSSADLGPLDSVSMEAFPSSVVVAPVTYGPRFMLRFLQRDTGRKGTYASEYRNVRVEWMEPDHDGLDCKCGTVEIALSGEAPSDIRLYRVRGTNRYVVKGRASASQAYDASDIRAIFTIEPGASRHVQPPRIFTRQHLSLAVVLVALGALAVAFLRSRGAIAYASRIHTWTEARLTYGGLIESETGAALGTLEQTRQRRVPVGPVLVAPEALTTGGLYRDMPIITPRHIAEGTHGRWAASTMRRLRDARALAVISTACTLLAFGARLIA